MKRFFLVLAVFVVITAVGQASGCASTTKIGDILASPLQFEGKEISVKGTIGNSFWISLINKGAYELDDGTGTIWVVTNQPPPQKGLQVSAKGTVSTAVKIGDRSLGTHLTETNRK
jgi:hypothetical protein